MISEIGHSRDVLFMDFVIGKKLNITLEREIVAFKKPSLNGDLSLQYYYPIGEFYSGNLLNDSDRTEPLRGE